MAVTDEYKPMTNPVKVVLFTELLKLKAEKALIDKKIKILEKGYKDQVAELQDDVFFLLPNGVKFSIKKSFRKGSLDTAALEKATGVKCEDFLKPQTIVHTLRMDNSV